ncbi:MAG: TIGR04348 family glycosyltransferase [Rhodospirillales bacterium]|nr:TIGR04348 family glycosyltransferase [Rhodospirillales bacterium]
MHIVLVTPAARGTRHGNRTTAVRWARILRRLGHRVKIATDYAGEPAALMIAVHAWRSAAAIARFRAARPQGKLILALSGTDINEYLAADPAPTLRSMETADRLVMLHDAAIGKVPRRLRGKIRVIHQSAPPLPRPRRFGGRHFTAAVIGHLREVKDPLRAAAASRLLPEGSRLRVVHVGAAHTPVWAAEAEAEMRANPRYVWRGDVSGAAVRRLLAQSHLLVHTSLAEGGANAVSEAVIAGVPVIASRIEGNIGLLGRDYPGYFAVGDTAALARLLRRAENDREFYRLLKRKCRARARMFRPAREVGAWRRLLGEISDG